MVYKIVLSNYSFFYITGSGIFPCVKSVEDSDDFIILFYNSEQEVISQVFFSTVKSVCEVHYESIEPFYKDVTEELRLRCKSSRGEGTGGQRSSSRDNDLMDFGDFFERIFIVLCDIGLVISGLIFLWLFLSKFLGGNL